MSRNPQERRQRRQKLVMVIGLLLVLGMLASSTLSALA